MAIHLLESPDVGARGRRGRGGIMDRVSADRKDRERGHGPEAGNLPGAI